MSAIPTNLEPQVPIEALIERGAMFVVNHSGGKDSQAMLAHLRTMVPDTQLVVVHAELPGVEWEGVLDHIRSTVGNLPLHVCRSRRTLLEMIEQRGMFPSPSLRQCTSDLKRGPIERTIRRLCKERATSLVVNCMGMRAQESSGRSRLEPFKFNARNSKAGRQWFDWLPIHDWTVRQVWDRIHEAGQSGHWAYAAGMSRLSCVFCIMASKSDLTLAASLNPTLFKRYVELERSTGQVMLMPSKYGGRKTLEEVTGIRIHTQQQTASADRTRVAHACNDQAGNSGPASHPMEESA